MKRIVRNGILLLLVLAIISASAEGAVFSVPANIQIIESEAFSGLPFDEVYIPSGVTQIGAGAFSEDVRTIYSFTGSAAEDYACENGIDFVPLDITDVYVNVSPFVSPYRNFNVSVSYVSYYNCTLTVSLIKDGETVCTAVSADAHNVSLRAEKGGIYDICISLAFRDFKQEFYFDGEVEVLEPVRLISDSIIMAPGDILCPIDDTEKRDVKSLFCPDSGIAISGLNIKALRCGTYTLTCIADQDGEEVYTEFTVSVFDRAEDILTGEAELYLPVGTTSQILPAAYPEGSGDGKFTFVSMDPAIASVDENGVVSALSQGKTAIRVSTFGAETLIPVQVTVLTESLRIIANFDVDTLLTGTQNRLFYEIAPAEADNVCVYWTSSDESVISIDPSTGLIKANNAGIATITAKAEDGTGATDSIRIAVRRGIDSVTVTVPSQMNAGDCVRAAVTYTPDNAVCGEFVYETDDPSVLTVEEDGFIHAVAAGQADLIVRAENGVFARQTITVFNEAASISLSAGDLSIGVGRSFDLSPLVSAEPANCDMSLLRYDSSDDSIVTISDSGVLTGVSAGTALITVSIGDLHAQANVRIVSPTADTIALDSSYLILIDGQTAHIKVSKPVAFFYTDSPELINVSMPDIRYLTITAKMPGNAKVFAVSASGSVTCAEIQVNPIVAKSIELNASELTLLPGEEVMLTSSVLPENTSERNISWLSTDETVCEVHDGRVLATGAGQAVVMAISPSGVSGECLITVTEIPMTDASLAADAVTVFAGESFDIDYIFEPANATPARFRWSADCDCCSVNGSTVTAISSGTCVITGEAEDASGLMLTLTVYVEEIPLRALMLSTDHLELTAGEQAVIDYSIYPHNACYAEAKFETSDESVASVDINGIVTAVSAGDCEIRVSAGYGEYEQVQTVLVHVESAGDVKYRALIMGQFTVAGLETYLPFSTNSTSSVRRALSCSAIDGEKYETTYLGASPARDTVQSAIEYLARTADEDDVTVLYMLAHGHYNTKTYSGYYMSTTSGSIIKDTALISAVTQIPGHVVLVVCTCNSGEIFRCGSLQAVMSNGGTYTTSRGTGHLSVICSTTSGSSSFFNVNDPSVSYDFFTRAFDQGIGWNIVAGAPMSMMADADADGSVTVGEIASFVPYRTQYLISSFRQLNGDARFWGNTGQYPKSFIASGDKDLKIISIQR